MPNLGWIGREQNPWSEIRKLRHELGQLRTARTSTAGGGVFPKLIRQFSDSFALRGSGTVVPVTQSVSLPTGYTQALVMVTFVLWGAHDGTSGTDASVTGNLQIDTHPPTGSVVQDPAPATSTDITAADLTATLTQSYSGLYTGLDAGASLTVFGIAYQMPNFNAEIGAHTAQLNGVVLFMR